MCLLDIYFLHVVSQLFRLCGYDVFTSGSDVFTRYTFILLLNYLGFVAMMFFTSGSDVFTRYTFFMLFLNCLGFVAMMFLLLSH